MTAKTSDGMAAAAATCAAGLWTVVLVVFTDGSRSPRWYPPMPVPLKQYLSHTVGSPKRSASLSENVRSMHYISAPNPISLLLPSQLFLRKRACTYAV